jgi:pimeloyl-ACP methyl ester carboxylesterase
MKSIRLNHVELSYMDRGEGIPLVLLHGFPMDHAMWDGQVVGLAKETGDLLVGEAFMPIQGSRKAAAPRCRVLVPDLRGFGASRSKQPHNCVTMEQFADDLVDWLNAIGVREPIVLGGLSMGGYIALQFWRKYSDRLRGLIFCDTRANADSPEAAASRRATADRLLQEGPGVLAEGMLPRLFSKYTREHNYPIVEMLQKVILAGDAHGYAAAMRGMAERPDMTASLGKIECPTLLLVGQEDALTTPQEMRAMAEAIPHATFMEIPNGGHLAPLENVAGANVAMGLFLAKL